MQKSETTMFFDYISKTSRPDVHEKRKMLFRPLSEGKYWSINLLVRSIDGNTRDRMWVSQALKAGAIKRNTNGALVLPSPDDEETHMDRVLTAIWQNDGDDQLSLALEKAVLQARDMVEASR